MFKQNLIKALLPIILSSLLVVVIVFAVAWREPTAAPPGGNVPPPLHQGEAHQTKIGGLSVGRAPVTLTTLTVALAAADTTATVGSTAGYPLSGILLIGSEAIVYTSTTATSFTGLTRGALGTTAVAHTTGTVVRNYLFTALATPTTPRMVITGDGNVGIGTPAPDRRLHVVDRIIQLDGSIPGFILNDTQTNGRQWVLFSGSPAVGNFKIRDNSVPADRLVINNDGNVGIGTVTPEARLDVFDTTALVSASQLGLLRLRTNQMSAANVGARYGLEFVLPGGQIAGVYSVNEIGGHTIGLAFRTWGATEGERMRIDNRGNVGIGTTAPENAAGWGRVLDVFGDAHSRIITRTMAIRTAFTAHNTGVFGAPAGGIIGTETNHPLSFMTNSASRLTIDTAGNVGIGTASPGGRLHITSDSAVTAETGIVIDIPGVGTRRVLIGPVDSAGAGFRSLRVAN